MTVSSFPAARPRRNRYDGATRRMVAENHLHIDNLIWPVFICEGQDEKQEIATMPGIYRVSLDRLIEHVRPAVELHIPAIALFPATPASLKDEIGSEALNPQNLICQAARLLKEYFPQLNLIGDVALDPYTNHGHDGLIKEGQVLNDETVSLLQKQALNQAQAGIDIIAPSDMMDGRVKALREILDEHDFHHVRIMSYAAKYASAFYGPFRDAVGTQALLTGDKKTYQMDPANSDEALREVALDIQEGADMFIVKPGLPYLDIIQRVKKEFSVPVFAYQVSGEYAMMIAAFEKGWLSREKTILESLMSFKRAGCNGIITYFAVEAAQLLTEKNLSATS